MRGHLFDKLSQTLTLLMIDQLLLGLGRVDNRVTCLTLDGLGRHLLLGGARVTGEI